MGSLLLSLWVSFGLRCDYGRRPLPWLTLPRHPHGPDHFRVVAPATLLCLLVCVCVSARLFHVAGAASGMMARLAGVWGGAYSVWGTGYSRTEETALFLMGRGQSQDPTHPSQRQPRLGPWGHSLSAWPTPPSLEDRVHRGFHPRSPIPIWVTGVFGLTPHPAPPPRPHTLPTSCYVTV